MKFDELIKLLPSDCFASLNYTNRNTWLIESTIKYNIRVNSITLEEACDKFYKEFNDFKNWIENFNPTENYKKYF